MNSSLFIEHLRAALPRDGLLTEAEDIAPYECDGLPEFRARPLAVVMPEDERQVQAVLRACNEFAVPVVPRGAGTGVSAGATPSDGAILLSTAKMRRVLEVDALTRTARVEPGVTNLSISECAAPNGLYYAPDPSSQIACSIGGNVAENAGGVHCLKYGLTTHNIVALRIVTSAGEVLEIGAASLDAAGYDLMAVLTGSEGLLGLVTEITVRLLPSPPATRVLLAFFSTLAGGSAAVSEILARGVIPAGLEMMDNAAIVATEAYVSLDMPLTAGGGLLCEIDGTPEEVHEQSAIVETVLRDCGAGEIRIADTEAERARVWLARKGAYPAIVRGAHDTYLMDCTIPRRALPKVLAHVAELAGKYQLHCANVFHAGDGNIHPILTYDGDVAGEKEKAEAFGEDVLLMCIEEGGTVTGEHGVGLHKLKGMCKQFSAPELAAFHGIKRAFDPARLLNPGKAVPELHHCSEFAALHVRKGQDRFAHLPRL
jgi:glycolate oxidase